MKLRFDDSMEEANNLFLGNHKLERIAQRLQEENEYVKEKECVTTSADLWTASSWRSYSTSMMTQGC